MSLISSKILEFTVNEGIKPTNLLFEKLGAISENQAFYLGFYIQKTKKGYLSAEKLFNARLKSLILKLESVCEFESEKNYLNIVKKYSDKLPNKPSFRSEKFKFEFKTILLKNIKKILKTIHLKSLNKSNFLTRESFESFCNDIESDILKITPSNYISPYLTHLIYFNNDNIVSVLSNPNRDKKIRNLDKISNLVNHISSREAVNKEYKTQNFFNYYIFESLTDKILSDTVYYQGNNFSTNAGFGRREYWVLEDSTWALEETYEDWRR
jgi:hypothetical protein